jgi:hypothetical protein
MQMTRVYVVNCGKKTTRAMRTLMEELDLTVNEEKTKVVIMPEGKFVFL